MVPSQCNIPVMDCSVQACGQASSSSAAAELLQLAGWWRPHEQISLLKSARTEVFPDAAQVSVSSQVCIPCLPLSHTDFRCHHTACKLFCCCVLPQTSTSLSCLMARALPLHALPQQSLSCKLPSSYLPVLSSPPPPPIATLPSSSSSCPPAPPVTPPALLRLHAHSHSPDATPVAHCRTKHQA